MAVPTTTLWSLEPHTKAKHRILRSYLDAWLPIMARWNERIVFIDGFAGPGRYEQGEEGSPLIALRAVLEHPHLQQANRSTAISFLFVEADAERETNLHTEIDALRSSIPFPSWLKVGVKHDEFATLIGKLLHDADAKGRAIPPIFAFVDPFGFSGIPMALLARIVRNPKSECLVSFMYESINRFLAHPNPATQSHFDELFGTSAWREIVDRSDPDQRRDGIVNLYRQQLQIVGGLKYVRTFEMINDGNRTEYFLYFGTNSRDGLSKMKRAMWRADPLTGSVFSDRSDPDQMVLIGFAESSQVARLAYLLREQFKDRGPIPIDEVAIYVLEETPFSEVKHLKKMTLGEMEKREEIRVTRPAGKRKRFGEYPSGTTIAF